MKRRELIKLVTLATGGILTIPLSSSLLTACKNVEKTDDIAYVLQFFSQEEFSVVKNLVDVILPKTDSPSATDVGVHQIVDTMVGTVYSKENRIAYTEQFSALKHYLSTKENKLNALQELSKSPLKEDENAKRGFFELKQQAIAYYLTTEEIAKKYLNYLPIPGEYKPCIQLDEVDGKAWAI